MKGQPSRVLVIADYPNARFSENIKPPVDFALSCGDVEDRILQDVLEIFRKPVFAVKGNHDALKPFPKGVRDVHFNLVRFRDWLIGGWQGVPQYKASGRYHWDDLAAAGFLARYPPVDIFICHAPLRGKTDLDDPAHKGSEALLRYVETNRPKYVFHGHVHQEMGAVIGDAAVVSVYGAKVVTLT